MSNSTARRWGVLFLFCGLTGAGLFFGRKVIKIPEITKENLAEAIHSSASFYQFPTEMDLPRGEKNDDRKKVHAVLRYSFDAKLQEDMERLLKAYKPDYGAFVAIDPATGRVLSMVSFSNKSLAKDNLALRATFPSASVFKVVTATAAIENNKYSANTVLSYDGSNHTLYRSNVLKTKFTRWTRYITLKEAFAKSINTVFGRIGAFALGPAELRVYADRFGFNRRIASDLPVQEGHAFIPKDPNDSYEIAQAASGFTRENTMSPLQGALIAGAVANDGIMMEPYIVQSAVGVDGKPLYNVKPRAMSWAMDPKTAVEMRTLMRETVIHGTSRGSFRGFLKGEFANMQVGGKTGSLTGADPKGRYDWFVGFADAGGQKLAVAALTIHEKYWKVKSSYLARKAFESYYKNKIAKKSLAAK